jgi:hypothetical protein
MNWDRRSRIFLFGAPLAVIPAVAFLPTFVFVYLQYPLTKALPGFQLWFALTVLVFAQVLGSILVGFAGFRPRFEYVTFLAAATSFFLMVVATYTGLFFAIFSDPN